MIKFEKLRMKNILSFGNTMTEVDFTKHKSTLLVGKNGNGKSSMIEALTFALYGKPYRKINKGQLVNSINGKNLLVELEFSIGDSHYKITRGIKPNKFEIEKNGKVMEKESSVAAQQEFLEKTILKMSYKAYSQIVVLGTATFVPFMQLSASDRREVIEDLVSLKIFTHMNVILKERIKQNKEDDKDSRYDLERANDSLVNLQEKKEIHNANVDDQKERVKEKLRSLMGDVESLNQDIKYIDNKIEEIGDDWKTEKINLEAKKTKFQGLLTSSTHMKKEHGKTIEFFEQNDTCPTCRQTIEEMHKEGLLEKSKNKLTSIEDTETKIRESIETLNANIDNVKKVETEYNNLLSDKKEKENRVGYIKSDMVRYKKEYDGLGKNDAITDIEADITQAEEKVVSMEKKRNNVLEEKNTLEEALPLLKDGGIKGKIIEKYIPIINTMINKYLAEFNFFADFNLDENFDETIRSRFRDEFSYASFSEGEKARINLALMLTWREIARKRNSVSSNLVIFDEVFDGSNDSDGIEDLKRVLSSGDSNYIVISHRPDTHDSSFDRIIEAKKVKNFTTLEVIE